MKENFKSVVKNIVGATSKREIRRGAFMVIAMAFLIMVIKFDGGIPANILNLTQANAAASTCDIPGCAAACMQQCEWRKKNGLSPLDSAPNSHELPTLVSADALDSDSDEVIAPPMSSVFERHWQMAEALKVALNRREKLGTPH